MTIIVISHHPTLVQHGQRVVEMKAGAIARDLSTKDFLAQTSLSENTVFPTQAAIEGLGIPVSSLAPSTLASELVLDAQHISYHYADGPTVIENESISVARGEFIALTGANGSGKSTLLNLLSQAVKPTQGEVHLNAQQLGFALQKTENQLFAATVREDIAFGPRNLGLTQKEVQERVAQTAEFLGISALLDRSVWNLSGGQQRLAAFAGVLAMKPDVLIVDEPTAGLDTQASEKILHILASLHRSGMTIIMVTHSLEHIQRLATRAIVLTGTHGFAREEFEAKEHTNTVRDVQDLHTQERRAPLSRFDPRVLTCVTMVTALSSFALHTPIQLAGGVLATLAFVLMARIRPVQLVRALHGFWIFITLIAVFNMFFVHSGTQIVRWGFIRITDEGVWASIIYGTRFALLATIITSMLHILPPNRITDAVESLCAPLKKRGLPVHELALTTSLSLRFLPILTRDFKTLVMAQELRGGTMTHGSMSARLRSLQALIIPSFANALRHADKLSIALDVRGFDKSADRVPWRVMRVTWRDYVLIAACVAYIALIIALNILGW